MARAGSGTLGWLPHLTGDAWGLIDEVCSWYAADLVQLGSGSIVCAPLVHAGDTFGALLFARGAQDGFDASSVELVAEISHRVGVQIANASQDAMLLEELQQVREGLAVAAHELRTPMAALRGSAQLLLRNAERAPVDTDEVQAGLSRIDQQSVRLVGMI